MMKTNDMKFARHGKAYQLVVATDRDLPHVLALDDSHWAATSAPVNAFKCDPQLLAYLDSDKNGRIRTDEIRDAVSWCLETLADTRGMNAGVTMVETAAIRADAKDGPGLLVTAAYVAEQTSAAPERIGLEHVRRCMDELRMKPLNGDGVIIPEAAEDPAVADYIAGAIRATGGDPDLSGQTGVGAARLAAFQTAIGEYLSWKDRGDQAGPDVMAFGADTHALWQRLERFAPQIDRFFMLAGFRDFDPGNAGKFLAAEPAAENPADALNHAPLAIPDEHGRLPLAGPSVNPVFTAEVAEIRAHLFGLARGVVPDTVTAAEWKDLKTRLAPYGAYMAAKKGGCVESLPLDKLRVWQDAPHVDAVARLIEADRDVARRVAAFSILEKLILYHGHLLRLINNFVSLSEFYAPESRALFERGSAVIDGRWFNFAIETNDPAAHSAVARASGIFTLYLKVDRRTDPTQSFSVALPATAGTRGNLSVGKRGIFFDIHGAEHDCVITQLIENPISLLEAVMAPFIKVGKMIMGKIEGLSASAEDAIMKGADQATTAPPAGAPAPAAPASPATLLMSVSISIAALGSGFAVLSKSFGGMTARGRLYAGLVGATIILLPIVIGGIIKLSRQDLSAILEGCGWAINPRMRLTGKLRRQFTERRPYPGDAQSTPHKRHLRIIAIILFIALVVGALILEWHYFMR